MHYWGREWHIFIQLLFRLSAAVPGPACGGLWATASHVSRHFGIRQPFGGDHFSAFIMQPGESRIFTAEKEGEGVTQRLLGFVGSREPAQKMGFIY